MKDRDHGEGEEEEEEEHSDHALDPVRQVSI